MAVRIKLYLARRERREGLVVRLAAYAPLEAGFGVQHWRFAYPPFAIPHNVPEGPDPLIWVRGPFEAVLSYLESYPVTSSGKCPTS